MNPPAPLIALARMHPTAPNTLPAHRSLDLIPRCCRHLRPALHAWILTNVRQCRKTVADATECANRTSGKLKITLSLPLPADFCYRLLL